MSRRKAWPWIVLLGGITLILSCVLAGRWFCSHGRPVMDERWVMCGLRGVRTQLRAYRLKHGENPDDQWVAEAVDNIFGRAFLSECGLVLTYRRVSEDRCWVILSPREVGGSMSRDGRAWVALLDGETIYRAHVPEETSLPVVNPGELPWKETQW